MNKLAQLFWVSDRQPPMSMNLKSTSGDLDWLAFCYAAGELNASEIEQFEARLAAEQPAREALARAVEMTQVVAAVEAQPCLAGLVVNTKDHWQSRAMWMALGGLAAALLIMTWTGVVGPSWKNAQYTRAARSQQHLARAWTQTREQMAAPAAAEVWSDFQLPPEAEEWLADSLAADAAELDAAELHGAPSWMMAAVYASSRGGESPNSETTERLEN